MKKWNILLVIACLAMIGQAHLLRAEPLRAGPVTADEALHVAGNWVRLILHQQGNWGGSPTAEVESVQEFRRAGRLVGYFCRVKPQGFIVVSLYKGLAPVKAYSEISGLDPASEEGLADLIKGGMERVLISAEQLLGPIDSLHAGELEDVLEINYRQAWEALQVDASSFRQRLDTNAVLSNYEGGDPPLLTTHWHQDDPYNRQCPPPPPGDDCTEDHCRVGCVATAGAQVMRHWAWPPSGIGSPYDDSYDWPNMANQYLWDDGVDKRWEDENGNPLSQSHLDAVAELSYEVGLAAGNDYCGWHGSPCGTTGWLWAEWRADLADALRNNFRYHQDANVLNRNDFSSVGYFNQMKTQLNLNRPLPYRVEGHFIVADGWREVYTGGIPAKQYHMNYGGSVAEDAWYSLDALPRGGIDEEYMLINVYPAPSLGPVVGGAYIPPPFPYRYFDQDATGFLAHFLAGHRLQFLPGVTVKCTGPDGHIAFHGSSSANTVLFTDGDTSRGIRIRSGQIYLFPDGGIKLYE